MKQSKKNRKVLAGIVDNAKRQAVQNYSGYELITAVEIINWIQESLLIELLKDHDHDTVQSFLQDCTLAEDETTD